MLAFYNIIKAYLLLPRYRLFVISCGNFLFLLFVYNKSELVITRVIIKRYVAAGRLRERTGGRSDQLRFGALHGHSQGAHADGPLHDLDDPHSPPRDPALRLHAALQRHLLPPTFPDHRVLSRLLHLRVLPQTPLQGGLLDCGRFLKRGHGGLLHNLPLHAYRTRQVRHAERHAKTLQQLSGVPQGHL